MLLRLHKITAFGQGGAISHVLYPARFIYIFVFVIKGRVSAISEQCYIESGFPRAYRSALDALKSVAT